MRFKDRRAWAAWLKQRHDASPGVWLRIAKKASGIASVSYAEAVEEALCYGWIDGQGARYDDSSWLVKFMPRGAQSVWSKINRARAVALMRSGRMKRAGRQAVERARRNGRWDAAYDSPRGVTVPSDFRARLNRNAKAKAFFATLNRANRYAVLFRIQTARRPETRAKRIRDFVRMLARNAKLHP